MALRQLSATLIGRPDEADCRAKQGTSGLRRVLSLPGIGRLRGGTCLHRAVSSRVHQLRLIRQCLNLRDQSVDGERLSQELNAG